MSRPGTDLYSVLGLSRDATQAEISHAYRVLLRRHHPDTRTSQVVQSARSDATLQQIIDAYAVLRDPERRAVYDEQATQVRGPARAARTRTPSSPVARTTEPPIQAGPVYWQPSQPRRAPDYWDRIQNLLIALHRWNQR
jgi:curved DNA-binding protein CbpA